MWRMLLDIDALSSTPYLWAYCSTYSPCPACWSLSCRLDSDRPHGEKGSSGSDHGETAVAVVDEASVNKEGNALEVVS